MRSARLAVVFLVATMACTALVARGADDSPTHLAATKAGPAANDAPPWNGVNSGSATIPGIERGVLIQSRGAAWRRLRPPIVLGGGILLAFSVAALVSFYLWRGPIGVSSAPTGRLIERFSVADRVAHWTMGLSFVVLAVSGLILTAGRKVLLPLVGYEPFSLIAIACKNIHAFLGPLFMLSLAYFIARYFHDNLPRRHDIQWLRAFGGMFSRKHVPSGRFNAGEKTLFWGLVCGFSVVLCASGLILDFPNFGEGRSLMQDATIIHLAIAFLAIAASLFHMYLGTVGVQGAYRAMRHGTVDESWAREHHELWYDEVKAGRSRQHWAAPAAPIRAIPANDD
ncbi:MAG: formate dehydrogenase subunit gamma [Usitatibacter sp.]